MSNLKGQLGICISILITSGCVDPYHSPAVPGDANLLVVDGFLDAADGSASVRLSRSRALSNDSIPEPELNAVVSIKTRNNDYTLSSSGNGTYTYRGIPIEPGDSYQLFIHTSDQKDFLSEEVEVKATPPIDSISWSPNDNGVFVLVTTHDPSGKSRYYRWDLIETWQYHAAVSSDYKVVNGAPVYRDDFERIYICWRTEPSTKISIATSERLSGDVIFEHPLTFLKKGSSQLMVKYSVLVKQHAISKNEYTFLEQLQKTTESLGGLFDPIPSQVSGNLRSLTDPSITVLGYFSAGIAQEKRFFLSYYDLPDDLKRIARTGDCVPDTIKAGEIFNFSASNIIGTAVYRNGFFYGYTITNPRCADCRYQGGVTTKPDFWP